MPNGQLKYCLSIVGFYNKGLSPKRGFQQRKLPVDAGEWPAISIKTARRSKESAKDVIFCLSNRLIKNDVCKVTKSARAWAEIEEPASKLSFTLVNLKTLWHLSQLPSQHAFGVE